MEKLPAESALHTELRNAFTDEELAAAAEDDRPHGTWSRAEMLAAGMSDQLAVVIQVLMATAGVKDVETPVPIRRPGVVGAKRKYVNPQAAAYLQSFRSQLERQQNAEGVGT